MTDAILTLNAGSSSIKFALYQIVNGINKPSLTGKIVNIGQQPSLTAKDYLGSDLSLLEIALPDKTNSHEALTKWLLNWLDAHAQAFTIVSVGHRVVHGGKNYISPTLIDQQTITRLAEFIPLAPMHQTHNLSAINAVNQWAPTLPQVACFDTSFHRTQNPLAQLFALPKALSEQGIIRYGFHGLSYEYIAHCLPQYIGDYSKGRTIVAHLGNGASMCAMRAGKSVATSMGFTALDGLMMGQRCGRLDAGVVIHLLKEMKMSIDEVQHMLYHESGLLGVSGISNNMQVLQDSNEPSAKQAIDLFCYRAACELGSLTNSINGLDTLVFTAGIGENSASVRRAICAQLSWLGVRLSKTANEAHQSVISHEDSAVRVLVIPTDEEIVIAKATHSLLKSL